MSKRVLVVEDSVLISSALRILLEANGYEVIVAGTARAAIDAAATSAPQVMLLDLTLPDADGLSVLEDLKARDAKPPLTLAMTGHDDDITHARCVAAGCDQILLKPVPINDLLKIIGDRVE